MASVDAAEDIFAQADTNRDGRIDKDEFRNWISKPEGLTTSSYESSTYELNRNGNTTSRDDRYKYKVSSQNALESTTDKYASYGTTAATSDLINDTVIHTSSVEETNRYIEKLANNIYNDPNPQIIRRAITESPVTYEQRVFVRYLQPPALLPQEPLIIKEVRPEQPPPPPPLVVREQPPPLSQPPPLILRERPQTPPARVSSETTTRWLPPVPVPPRSVVIERFPPLPEKPRDIIIERWIPYGPQSERRTIVQHARPAIKYPQPSHTVVVYDGVQTYIFRKLEKLGVTQENPDAYVARYRTSVLDSATFVQQARNAGVIEDISHRLPSYSITANKRGNIYNFDRSNEIINQGFSSSGGTIYARIQRVAGKEAIHLGNRSYLSSGSHGIPMENYSEKETNKNGFSKIWNPLYGLRTLSLKKLKRNNTFERVGTSRRNVLHDGERVRNERL